MNMNVPFKLVQSYQYQDIAKNKKNLRKYQNKKKT